LVRATHSPGPVTYPWNDAWKTDLTALVLSGPSPSLFGKVAINDQIRLQLISRW
jgi:hypothetical protein